jgi:hypothetical protein
LRTRFLPVSEMERFPRLSRRRSSSEDRVPLAAWGSIGRFALSVSTPIAGGSGPSGA